MSVRLLCLVLLGAAGASAALMTADGRCVTRDHATGLPMADHQACKQSSLADLMATLLEGQRGAKIQIGDHCLSKKGTSGAMASCLSAPELDIQTDDMGMSTIKAGSLCLNVLSDANVVFRTCLSENQDQKWILPVEEESSSSDDSYSLDGTQDYAEEYQVLQSQQGQCMAIHGNNELTLEACTNVGPESSIKLLSDDSKLPTKIRIGDYCLDMQGGVAMRDGCEYSRKFRLQPVGNEGAKMVKLGTLCLSAPELRFQECRRKDRRMHFQIETSNLRPAQSAAKPVQGFVPDLSYPLPAQSIAQGMAKAVVANSKLWPKTAGPVRLKYCLMEGQITVDRRPVVSRWTSKYEQLVKDATAAWSEAAYVAFDRIKKCKKADLRIAVATSICSSAIGTDAKLTQSKEPTMVLGCVANPSVSDVEARAFVLHEVGHSLGLLHEHQSSRIPFTWDENQVEAHLRQVAGWTSNEVLNNVLRQVDGALTDYDADSIMVYEFPAWYTIEGVSQKKNFQISALDRAGVCSMYPFPGGCPTPLELDTGAPIATSTSTPTHTPTAMPTHKPTRRPTDLPTAQPTLNPTATPTEDPVKARVCFAGRISCGNGSSCIRPKLWCDGYADCPDGSDEASCTVAPSFAPSRMPTRYPTNWPTYNPTPRPSRRPTHQPTPDPTTAQQHDHFHYHQDGTPGHYGMHKVNEQHYEPLKASSYTAPSYSLPVSRLSQSRRGPVTTSQYSAPSVNRGSSSGQTHNHNHRHQDGTYHAHEHDINAKHD